MLGVAQALVAFLEEEIDSFKIHGLNELLKISENEWPEISESIDIITNLSKDESFTGQKLAALLASKLYYYMGNFSQAVQYAVLSGDHFNPVGTDPFTCTLVSHAIQDYIDQVENSNELPSPALTHIVNCVLKDLTAKGQFSKCLVLAIETRSLQDIESTLKNSPNLVMDAVNIVNNNVSDIEYRSTLLNLLVRFASDNCNKIMLSQLFHSLRDANSIAQLLIGLKSTDQIDNWLLAYQISFELAENGSQKFRSQIVEQIPPEMAEIKDIITRQKLLQFYLQFLFNNHNKNSIEVIKGLREGMDDSRKLIHTSIIMAYSYMFAGTGDDSYFRNNAQWFFNSTEPDWSEFITIAAIGAIHNGRHDVALQILGSHLKKGAAMHSLGGALYALGLIFSNYFWDPQITEIITNAITNTTSNVVKHGGSLGLGLVAMGSHNTDFYELLKSILFEDDPISGEAAAYGIGLINLGKGSHGPEVFDLLKYAKNCKHDKIVRGLAIAFALMSYGSEQECESLVEALMQSKESLFRESAAWVIALSYVGTANNLALQRLLHFAVSDVNPDVRRAAVISIGFVLSRSPKEVPGMVDLLAKSYHPYVRNGAALAIGIACAGTGMQEAIDILKPLLNDLDKFVVQSAVIAIAMVLQQQSDAAVPYCKEFRQYLRKKITKNNNEILAFGVNLAYGIMYASGRNTIISCNTLNGENNALSTVALVFFANTFYWHPLALMLTLSFQPTAIIGVDKELKTPKWKFFSSGRPSLYADPPSFESETIKKTIGEARKLSVNKNKVEENKEGDKKEDKTEAEKKETEKTPENVEKKPEETQPAESGEEKKEEPAVPQEPVMSKPKSEMTPEERAEYKRQMAEYLGFQKLKNASRVTLNQLSGIDIFSLDYSYTPIIERPCLGIIMLKENEDEEEEAPNENAAE